MTKHKCDWKAVGKFGDTEKRQCSICGRVAWYESKSVSHWLTCPHRGDPIATINGRVAGCGCDGSTVEIYNCQWFAEPVLKQAAARCLDQLQKKVPTYQGRTCRECQVPRPTKTTQQVDRFNVNKHLAGFPYHAVSKRIAAVTCHFNPHMSRARNTCYATFSRQFPRIGLDLFCAEGTFGGRAEIPDSMRFELDSWSPIFAKENLLNLIITKLPDQYDRILWIDSDVLMLPHDYVDRLTAALDAHRVVQAFARLRYLGPHGEPETAWRSSVAKLNKDKGTRTASPQHAYPGLAWACDRQLLVDAGGLYDRCVTGAGDVAWTTAVYGDRSVPYLRYWSDSLVQSVLRYGERVTPLVPSVGVVESSGVHLYHGKLAARQYTERNRMLRETEYDPERHLEYAPNGTLRWSREAPAKLKQAVHAYMHGRREDET